MQTKTSAAPDNTTPATGAILGVGMDMVETSRLERALRSQGERFRERVFTPAERAECAPLPDPVQALAARWAAKEACLKALGTGWAEGVTFDQVAVVRGRRGKPALRLTGAAAERARALGVRRTHVSLTDLEGLAAAVVVLEG